MKHNIRINGSVTQIDCELGTGLRDRNDVEIFEGDIIKNVIPPGYVQDDNLYIVYFRNCSFLLIREQDWDCRKNCGATPLGWNSSASIEVVGHVNATPFKDTRRAWSPQLRDAYNRLLDAFIACKSPQTVCEAALAVVKAAKADNRFDED